jgi:hypothetical protein
MPLVLHSDHAGFDRRYRLSLPWFWRSDLFASPRLEPLTVGSLCWYADDPVAHVMVGTSVCRADPVCPLGCLYGG